MKDKMERTEERLAADQLEVPGTEKPTPKKRVTLLERAIVGDLCVAYGADMDHVLAIEQVSDSTTAEEIVSRWKDQGVTGKKPRVEVWECRPGGYYRRRSS